MCLFLRFRATCTWRFWCTWREGRIMIDFWRIMKTCWKTRENTDRVVNTVRILMRWWENVLDSQRSLQVHLDEQKLSAGVCLYFSHSHEQSRVFYRDAFIQSVFIWMRSVNTWSVRVYLCVSSHCFSVFCWLTLTL